MMKALNYAVALMNSEASEFFQSSNPHLLQYRQRKWVGVWFTRRLSFLDIYMGNRTADVNILLNRHVRSHTHTSHADGTVKYHGSK